MRSTGIDAVFLETYELTKRGSSVATVTAEEASAPRP